MSSQNGSWMILQMWGKYCHYRCSPRILSTIVANNYNLLLPCRLDAALDLEYDITKQYTGSYFEEEIKGLADASGADEKTIRRIHMIGELTYGKSLVRTELRTSTYPFVQGLCYFIIGRGSAQCLVLTEVQQSIVPVGYCS